MVLMYIRPSKITCFVIASVLILGISASTVSASPILHTYTLAEDPTFITYFGGSNTEDATKVAFDNEGNTILIGQTMSSNLPVTDNAFQSEDGGGDGDWDSFIAKFSTTGELLFCSYLGGSGYEHVTSVNVDSENNVVVAGTTQSTGLPTTAGALHESPLGQTDGFIFKIAPNGTVLYGTYFGGTGQDWIYGMEFDDSGNYLFSGWTTTAGLATSGVYQTSYAGGGGDAFVARISADGSTLQMFSYVGGVSDDKAWTMTVDNSYNFIISGVASLGFPVTSGAYQGSHGGSYDAFLVKVSYSGVILNFSTFIGGSGDDLGLGVDVDSHGDIILTGDAESSNINTMNAVQEDFAGGTNDFFASKFNSTGSPYFVTYIGGNDTDRCWDARVDADDNLILVGRTSSADFPAFNGLNDTKASGLDACVMKLSSDGQTILASTFIGGGGEDIGEGIAVDEDGNIVVTGRTWSLDLPTTEGAYQEEKSSLSDVFVCHAPFLSRSITVTTTTTPSSPIPPPDDITMIAAVTGGVVIIVILAFFLKRKA
ncbi:MAG: SBBP repeat-containing protein [Candidatus Thorarchaeota archaeon]